MYMPAIRGVIERRILVNYRVDADWAAPLLPAPFRPWLLGGRAIAGLCLIRLGRLRPRGLPALFNLRSENLAHRIAVEWNADGERRRGVYVWRRDTASRWIQFAGGRFFPGVHHEAAFVVDEAEGGYHIDVESLDGEAGLSLEARIGDGPAAGSAFRTLYQASDFFQAGAVGYSLDRQRSELEGLRLETFGWDLQALDVKRVSARFFDNPVRFPPGTVEFDSAFVMHNVDHEWRMCPAPAA